VAAAADCSRTVQSRWCVVLTCSCRASGVAQTSLHKLQAAPAGDVTDDEKVDGAKDFHAAHDDELVSCTLSTGASLLGDDNLYTATLQFSSAQQFIYAAHRRKHSFFKNS